jgi:pimeloyl-ACP methyl ester carboxylesterase/predicted glycosyltransferase
VRARYPDIEGYVERDGVKVGYEVYGSGPTTVVFPPVDLIVHSRAWKAQIPYLSRFYRVVVIDPRGNGRSDGPHDPALLTDLQLVADTLAVMDEVSVDRAVLVGLCSSNWTAAVLAAEHPERVTGIFAIAPGIPFITPRIAHRREPEWDESMGPAVGWQKESVNYFRNNWRDFVEFFFSELLPEPHSTKQWEDCVAWAMEVDLASMIAVEEAPLCVADQAGAESMLARIRCPVFAVHGAGDMCQPPERSARLAELTGGRFVTLEGAGHLPQAREPVVINHLIREFVDGLTPRSAPVQWTRPMSRQRKVLMVSSPIGLGHTRRDIAIAQELRALRPDVQIDWLAQAPVSDVAASRGETVHPASAYLASEVEHFESESAEHDLHAFQAIRQMDEILVNNFMVFDELVRDEQYDLWVADEGWDVDYFLHENPELKSSAYVWLTDFVGWLPMPDGGEPEQRLTTDYNAEMVEQVARFPRLRDRALFIGDPQDCVPDGLGDGLPSIRQWTESNFDFTGYITGYQPLTDDERLEVRSGLGWTDDEKVVVVAVGGTAVGGPLLRRAVAAYPLAAAAVPDLRMVVVAGPRIDPASLKAPAGVEVQGYVPDLYRLLAASDLALVQGGLTTTMELVANRRPFLYVPLRHHFEQTFHVTHRLDRYGGGHRLDYDDTAPEPLAAAIAANVGQPVSYAPVATDGAARAASRIAEMV